MNPESPRSKLWIVIAALLVLGGVALLGCAGLVVYLVVDLQSSYQRAMAAQQRVRTGNRLKQVVIALQMYVDEHGQLPPAVVVDGNGEPLYSGRLLLLPYLEQAALYERFDKTKAWNSPENIAVSQTLLDAFVSPLNSQGNAGQCDLVFVTGPGTAFDGNKSVKYADITDGLDKTLVLVETNSGPPSWAAPGEWDASAGPLPMGLAAGFTTVAFVNGSVQQLDTKQTRPKSRALSTIAGGEQID